MNTLDLNRLATDREYWDSVAPEGAEHFAKRRDGDGICFYRNVTPKQYEFFYTGNGDWQYNAGSTCHKILFSRPEPTPAWAGQGLPPVGTVCEGYVLDTCRKWKWVKVEILKHNNIEHGECATHVPSLGVLRWCDQFRPIRSEEDEAVTALQVASQGCRGVPISATQAINLYRAGYKK